jgi:hypothetical protein
MNGGTVCGMTQTRMIIGVFMETVRATYFGVSCGVLKQVGNKMGHSLDTSLAGVLFPLEDGKVHARGILTRWLGCYQ